MMSIRLFLTTCLAWLMLAMAAPAFADPVILNRGNGAEPDTLDPQKATGQWENNIIGDMLIGLMTDDAEGKPIPGMALSYETSPDGLVWTFHLRPDAVWSDGVPVTAGDFVFALQRINDPNTASQYASLTYIVKNAEKVNAQTLPPDQIGARAVDDHTLELTLEHPAPYLPSLLLHYTFFPVPKHIIDKVGNAWTKPGNYVSNGPYVLADWRPNDHVHVVKNPRFYDAANVKIDEVNYFQQDDQSAGVKRFRAHEYDIQQGIPGQLITTMKHNMPQSLRLSPYLTTWYIVFNLKKAPWTDVRVREALGLAIDRKVITDKILKAGELPAYELVPPGIPNYPHAAKLDYADLTMPQRLLKAKQLLADAGYGPDHPLKFQYVAMNSTDSRFITVALQSMWRMIGVDMRPSLQETKTVYTLYRQQNFDVGWAGWAADYPDTATYLYLAHTRSAEMNYAKYSNPAFDTLSDAADNEADPIKRGDIQNKAEQMILDDAPMVPVYHAVSRNLVAPYVLGWKDALTNIHRTRFLSIDSDQQVAEQSAGQAQKQAVAAASAGDQNRPWYWWIVAAWDWLIGLPCSVFGVACGTT